MRPRRRAPTRRARRATSLAPGIIVLSACETELADGGWAATRWWEWSALLIAGAARVLASLWPVGDDVTLRVMASFYGALGEGHEPASALRVAQANVRRDHPHPFHWSAFVLYGGG